jgi:hypothetical protein
MDAQVDQHEVQAMRLQMAELAAEVRRLSDRLAIIDLYNTYARGIDRSDVDLLKTVYHPDAIDEHGMFSGLGTDFADFVVPYIKQNYRMMQHHHSTLSVEVDGDAASAECYYLCVQQKPTGELEFSAGRTADRLERRGGRWGLTYRQVIMDWTWVIEAPEPTSIDGKFVKGQYYPDDISYRVAPTLRGSSFPPSK